MNLLTDVLEKQKNEELESSDDLIGDASKRHIDLPYNTITTDECNAGIPS